MIAGKPLNRKQSAMLFAAIIVASMLFACLSVFDAGAQSMPGGCPVFRDVVMCNPFYLPVVAR